MLVNLEAAWGVHSRAVLQHLAPGFDADPILPGLWHMPDNYAAAYLVGKDKVCG